MRLSSLTTATPRMPRRHRRAPTRASTRRRPARPAAAWPAVPAALFPRPAAQRRRPQPPAAIRDRQEPAAHRHLVGWAWPAGSRWSAIRAMPAMSRCAPACAGAVRRRHRGLRRPAVDLRAGLRLPPGGGDLRLALRWAGAGLVHRRPRTLGAGGVLRRAAGATDQRPVECDRQRRQRRLPLRLRQQHRLRLRCQVGRLQLRRQHRLGQLGQHRELRLQHAWRHLPARGPAAQAAAAMRATQILRRLPLHRLQGAGAAEGPDAARQPRAGAARRAT